MSGILMTSDCTDWLTTGTDWHCYVTMWQDVCTMRQEQFEHTHVVIASCKSKKNRQYTNTKETYWSTKHYTENYRLSNTNPT